MIKGLKICGVSDPKTLNFILNHNQRPAMIGFITNYEKSKRFVEYEKLKSLINFNKKDVSFVSVLVKPNDEILEKIKDLNFDYYQLYDVSPERTKEIKSKFCKRIITALTISSKADVIKYKDYSLFSMKFEHTGIRSSLCVQISLKIKRNLYILLVQHPRLTR